MKRNDAQAFAAWFGRKEFFFFAGPGAVAS
jgi:hypothetical protein